MLKVYKESSRDGYELSLEFPAFLVAGTLWVCIEVSALRDSKWSIDSESYGIWYAAS